MKRRKRRLAVLLLLLVPLALLHDGCGPPAAAPRGGEEAGETIPKPATSGSAGGASLPAPSEGVPRDIPVMRQAGKVDTSTEGSIAYSVPASSAEVLQFYEKEMPANGWALQASLGVFDIYSKGSRTVRIHPMEQDDGATSMLISWADKEK